MKDIRAITIDLDDTLWEIMPVIIAAEQRLRTWLASNFPKIPENFSSADSLKLRAAVELEFPERAHDLTFLRVSVLGRMAIACGYPANMAQDAFRVFDEARNEVRFYPDVLPSLELLKVSYPLIAVTNGNANLHKIGIGHMFKAIVTAVDAGAAKPHQSIFAMAVGRAGVLPEHVLHIGDDPKTDIQGAQEAGMKTGWINRTGRRWPDEIEAPDLVIRSMRELPRLLSKEGF